MSLVFRSRQRVMRLATARASGTAPVSPSAATAAMDRLDRLHEVGVLSESELAEVKAATLRRIPPD
jgi:hypothetical protein